MFQPPGANVSHRVMEVLAETEDIIFRFFRRLPDEEIKELNSAYEMAWKLDEETISEIKDAVWDLLQRRIAWGRIYEDMKNLVEADDTESEAEAAGYSSGTNDD
jgi:hypothetical protein